MLGFFANGEPLGICMGVVTKLVSLTRSRQAPYECLACGQTYDVQHYRCPECGSFRVEVKEYDTD